MEKILGNIEAGIKNGLAKAKEMQAFEEWYETLPDPNLFIGSDRERNKEIAMQAWEVALQAGWNARKAIDVEIAESLDYLSDKPVHTNHDAADAIREKE